MKKFDLKKFLAENKATFHSSLSENESTYEGKKSKKYYKDAEADDAEHIKALEKDMKDDKKASKKLKENINKPTTVPELIFQIQKKYPRMNWLESELPNNPTFQDVKGTLEDNGYGKIYDEFMSGDIADITTDLNETNTKMKVSELKAKIKEMVLSEMALDVDKMEDAPEDEVDFLAELEGMLKESPMDDPRVEEIIQMLNDIDVDGETMEYILRQVGMDDQMANQLVLNKMELDSLNEMENMMGSKFDDEGYEGSDDHFQDTIDESGLWPALMKFKDEGFSLEHVVGWIEANWYMINEADEKAADEEAAADVTVDDTETTDVETTAEVNPNVKAVQDSLTQAQAAAQKLGDKKLIDQIGNTITFFTRTHVVEKPGTVTETKPIELPNQVKTQTNTAVTNAATMAQQMLNFYDQIKPGETTDFEKDTKFKMALTNLRDLVKPLKAAGTVAEIEALKEMLLLQKKAGIISETQYKKKLEELETGTYKYYSKNELNDNFFKEFGNYVMFSAPVPPSDMDDEDEMSTSYFLVKPETADDNSKVDKFMELTLRRALRNKKVKIGTPNEKSGIATLSIPAIYVEK